MTITGWKKHKFSIRLCYFSVFKSRRILQLYNTRSGLVIYSSFSIVHSWFLLQHAGGSYNCSFQLGEIKRMFLSISAVISSINFCKIPLRFCCRSHNWPFSAEQVYTGFLANQLIVFSYNKRKCYPSGQIRGALLINYSYTIWIISIIFIMFL